MNHNSDNPFSAHKKNQSLVRVGITHGDLNSISYEVILKTLAEPGILELFTPVLYGSSKIASYHRKAITIEDLPFNHIRKAGQAQEGKLNIVNLTDREVRVTMGQSTPEAGELAALALRQATDDLEEGVIDVLVTGPINKHNIQSETFQFPGHTEYLSTRFKAKSSLMFMVAGSLRVGVVTGHLPLREVPANVTRESILRKIRLMESSLKTDFGITKPRIAVLSLNPHAGDEGLLGSEENEVIAPVINQAFDEGIHVFGPYATDGFFGSGNYRAFDGILAMYHDQGLPIFKLLADGQGVNFTAGLPFVRTSPAHGTAYELAGKDQAGHESMRAAIYLAIDIFNKRKDFAEMSRNPLKSAPPQIPDYAGDNE